MDALIEHGCHRKGPCRTDGSRRSGKIGEQKHMNDGPEHQRIAELAYGLWQKRGCPIGSPDEDWFRAENELRRENFVGQLVSAFATGPIEL